MSADVRCEQCSKGIGGRHRKWCTPQMRFWRKVEKSDTCWAWTGATHPHGYGQLRVHGRLEFAHRLAWVQQNGPIPEGMHVCHTCDNPPCCNPDHLFLGTPADNMADMDRKGRRVTVTPPRATRCIHGHKYTDENTYINKYGWQSCRTCHRQQEFARRRRECIA